MFFFDFHTHRVPEAADVVAVVDGRDTWGIHPWRADVPAAVPVLEGRLAIGECGLDALRGPALDVQEAVLYRQVLLSEAQGLPLVIHCVKALDRLLALRREWHPSQPWMLHGFRGKPQQLRSLLAAGFYVSFGAQYNPDSLRLCPLDRLMLETDDAPAPTIHYIYSNAAQVLGIPMDDLCARMAENYRAFFPV